MSGPESEPAADPLVWWQDALAVLRRRAPEVLDQVAELAGALAASLRAMEAGDPAHDAANRAGDAPDLADSPPSAAPPLPSTVRIDVQD